MRRAASVFAGSVAETDNVRNNACVLGWGCTTTEAPSSGSCAFSLELPALGRAHDDVIRRPMMTLPAAQGVSLSDEVSR